MPVPSRIIGRGSRAGLRTRRGATLVFVALLGLLLVGMAAFAIDLSRAFVGTNELQTGTDAAALRGALRLQMVPGASPADSVVAFASGNPALAAPITVNSSDVLPMFFDPATNTASGSTWALANAVQVTAQRSVGLFFGRVLRSMSPMASRTSIAWLANLSASKCIVPWTVPMESILPLVGAAASPLRALTQAEVADFAAKPVHERMILMGAPLQTGKATYSAPPSSGRWSAIKNYGGNGKQGYVNAVANVECVNNVTALGTTQTDAPNASLDGWTTDGLANICHFAAGSDNCYDSPSHTTRGVKFSVAFADAAPSAGNDPIKIWMLGDFVILCYRQKAANNSCDSDLGGGEFVSATEWKKYDESAMLAYIQVGTPDLGQGTQLSNVISTNQRLILVK